MAKQKVRLYPLMTLALAGVCALDGLWTPAALLAVVSIFSMAANRVLFRYLERHNRR